MGYIIANIGKSSNIPCWDIRCDTEEDRSELEVKKIPPGSTVYIINTGTLYMLNSKKEWI
jgi:hypothetical protein